VLDHAGNHQEGVADRSLHPFTIAIEFVRLLGRFAYLIVFAIVANFMGMRVDGFQTVIGIFAGIQILGATIRYLSFRYGVGNGLLTIRSGIVTKQHRSIPLERIQNINLERSALHRILKIVDLKIETASGAGTEAVLSAVSEQEAELLRAELQQIAPAAAVPQFDIGSDAIWKASPRELILYGATQNRAGAIIASILGIIYLFGEGRREAVETVTRLPAYLTFEPRWLLVTLAIVVLLLAGWLLSIISTVLTYHGFTVSRAENRLKRKHGLLNQLETVIPIRRIQLLRFEAPWLRRIFGLQTLKASTAGSFTEQEGIGTTPICLIAPPKEVAELARSVLPQLRMQDVEWHQVSRLHIRRSFFRWAFKSVFFTGAIAYFYGAIYWLLLPALLALGLVVAFKRFAALGYARHNGFLLCRWGLWVHQVVAVPEDKIQWTMLTQDIFQLRLRLATLSIGTATLGGVAALVVDLPREIAESLVDDLAVSTHSAGYWSLDGV
jgi:putative membrane protein